MPQNLTPKGLSLPTVVVVFICRYWMLDVIDSLQSLSKCRKVFERLIVVSFSASEPLLHFLASEHFSHVDADPHEVALWALLKRTKSADKAVRLQAVQELAENHHWHGKTCRWPLQMTPFWSRVSKNESCFYISTTFERQTTSIRQPHRLLTSELQ